MGYADAENLKLSTLIFYVNGQRVIDNVNHEITLIRYLREKLHLCGTKLGCAEGGCGACTVMVSKYDRESKKLKHYAANACLMPVCNLHGLSVTTVEGIGSTRTRLHSVQERIAMAHGSQCGFCTPGFVMSMYTLLRNSPKPSIIDLELAFQGNLCRCTGYRPILDGYRTFTKELQCELGENCCKNKEKFNECGVEVDNELFDAKKFMPYDPTQEPIFPPELKLNDQYDKEILIFTNDRAGTWYRPTELSQLLQFKKNYPMAKIVVGNTEVGVEVKFKNFDYKYLVSPTAIKELNEIKFLSDGIKFGASVSLSDVRNVLQNQVEMLPEHETKIFSAIVSMLKWFAGMQIRNVASIGGNIMTGSPISDLNPIFMAANVDLEVESIDEGKRTVKMNENFFIGYRKNVIKDTEVLISIFIPKSVKNQHFIALKQAKRREDDIAIVNGAFNIKFKGDSTTIENARLAFGGVGTTTIMPLKTANIIKHRTWNQELVEDVSKSLMEEISLSPDAPGGVVVYRRSLTLSLFFKAYLSISRELEKSLKIMILSERDKSGAEDFHRLNAKTTHLFEKVSSEQQLTDPLRRSIIHSSAFKQATGEAIYCDDIPKHENELYLALVLSTRAHAKILSIDASDALKQPGVHAFFSAKDLAPKQNKIGKMVKDEELFISEIVTSQGQILGAIAADNQMLAQRAAKMVNVEYADLFPVIITIEDAIKHNSLISGYPVVQSYGDIEQAMKEADHIVEGQSRTGGQEQFYMETQATIAIPRDSDELELICSNQDANETQKIVAEFLGIPCNRIVCKIKRLGGAFGGKETRATYNFLPVALAAYKLKRPVRIMFDRDEDMQITGGRNPFLIKYKVAFKNDGKIIGLDVKAFVNAGYSLDYSGLVLERAMDHVASAYKIANVRIEGTCLKTNLPSNTAFRGFGGPQGMMVGEHAIRDVARTLGKDYIELMNLNLHQEGDLTHFGQLITNCNVKRCFMEVQKNSHFAERIEAVAKFNEKNRWKKRGISLTNLTYGIGFPFKILNQANALVHIYTDGSVLLSHGGIEMGQGLYIKTMQVAATTLKISIEKIHIQEMSTDKCANSTETAASVGSDLFGSAVLNACQILYERLAPYREKSPDADWSDWIKSAYFDRVSLSAVGFYATPDIGLEIKKPYNYFSFGSGVSEVEIDCLTGDHQVIRTDIVMDVGSSLNPAIDIGQIEGAFMQGYGLFVLEELIYSPTGTLYSRGPGMYKIPSFGNIPSEFNISLLTGAPNPRAVYSSKAIGEPPLFLASSVFFAIKEAIGAARKEEGLDPYFFLQSPATSARIRMGCQDKITAMFEEPKEEANKSWNVVL